MELTDSYTTNDTLIVQMEDALESITDDIEQQPPKTKKRKTPTKAAEDGVLGAVDAPKKSQKKRPHKAVADPESESSEDTEEGVTKPKKPKKVHTGHRVKHEFPPGRVSDEALASRLELLQARMSKQTEKLERTKRGVDRILREQSIRRGA